MQSLTLLTILEAESGSHAPDKRFKTIDLAFVMKSSVTN
jgi:hypothetical protein